jgi:hypothetical protein
MVERNVANVKVAGSNPATRSSIYKVSKYLFSLESTSKGAVVRYPAVTRFPMGMVFDSPTFHHFLKVQI